MLSFIVGESELAERIRAFPWEKTSLGDTAGWPVSLRTLVSVMLGANQPMFIVWGPDRLLLHNDQYISVLQGHHPGALGRPFLDVWSEIADDLRPLVEGAYAGTPSHMEDILLIMERNGYPEETHFAYSYTPVPSQSGGVEGFFCACIETTEQVMAARRIRESEVRNRQVLDSASDYAIIATGLDGRVTRWNEGARRVLGWTEEEMLGQSAERIFTPEDRAAGQPAIEMRSALSQGRGNDERWHNRQSGERFYAAGEMTPLRDASGEAVGFVKVLRDRTEQRLAEERLAASRSELDVALANLRNLNENLEHQVAERTAERDQVWRNSRDLLAVANVKGVWLSVSPAWTRLLGWSEAELVGRTSTWLEHPDDVERTRAEVAHLATGGTTFAFENRFRNTAGDYRWLSWTAAPEGGLLYCSGRDITAEKERQAELLAAQDQLRQAQKVEAVGQLTGGVAHDFNNLLTVIRGSVDLMRRPGITDERRSRYIDAIADSADRATRLTNQLLAFSRRQALTPQVFDVRDSVEAIRDMIGTLAGPRVRIVIDRDDAVCLVHVDRNQFDTALINMAVNARDAMDSEGTLHIGVRAVSCMPAMRSHAAVPGEFVAVSLTDTGSGIPIDDLDRIFEPFFTTKGVGEGTGLGLSQVFGFAKQSGGEIMVESENEGAGGATFTLYLPRDAGDVPATALADHAGKREEPADGLCVLVVEDDPEVGTFARAALEELGYGTVLAPDAAHALGELNIAGRHFDAVFSDVVMPGMSGIELAREIGHRFPDLPVVLTSGYSTVLAEEGHRGLELIRKPYSVDELARILRKVTTARAISRPE